MQRVRAIVTATVFAAVFSAAAFAQTPTPPAPQSPPADSGGQNPPPPPAPQNPPDQGGGAAAGSKVFNPDMAVIGDFLGALGKNNVNPDPVFQMHESEVSFQAVVDPYARADFFISFGEEGVELEEGFVTFPTLPAGLLLKVGKIRAAFGKVNTLHNHVLTWTDRPLVINNLVGGEEGIDDAGLSVARLIGNPWIFLEATGQIFRGDSSDLFHSSERNDVSFVGHLRGYHDITESTNIDVGGSYAFGHNASGVVDDVDLGRFETELAGVDVTFRWRPLQRSIYHSFVARSELVWSWREQPDGRQNSQGFYVSGDYQLARRWFGGVRIDASDRADAAFLRDTSQSAVITYWPSEFSQVRGQYRHISFAGGEEAHEFLFQFQFSIGAHGAHPF